MADVKITMITITYNSAATLRETLESVRAQHYDNLEYLIIDGASTDGTLDMVAEYSDVVTRVVSEPDRGISDAMNKGIRLASGELVGIIHSDDILAEGALAHLAACWDGKSDVYSGEALVMREDGTPMHVLKPERDLSRLQYGFCLSHPSTFVTRAAYERYGLYDTELRCCMDYELFLRFYKAGAVFSFVPSVLAHYRMGGINQKFRRRTLRECCEVSVRYGGNRVKATALKYKKMLQDIVRPMAYRLGMRNRRVQRLQ